MATTKIFPIHADVEGALAYIANPEKTDNGRLVYAFELRREQGLLEIAEACPRSALYCQLFVR